MHFDTTQTRQQRAKTTAAKITHFDMIYNKKKTKPKKKSSMKSTTASHPWSAILLSNKESTSKNQNNVVYLNDV